jgi:hypothetical protein
VVFNVRGGRNARIPIVAESIVPDVRLEQPRSDALTNDMASVVILLCLPSGLVRCE